MYDIILLVDYKSAIDEKKIAKLKIVLPIVAFLLLLTCIALVWMYKCRGRVTNVLLLLKYGILIAQVKK